ncbi:MAG: DNA-processing protein DprA [Acidimicrobiia bacterium]
MSQEVTVVDRGDEGYPPLLETISDPPARLWIRGELGESPGVAIVGTRRATRYGLEIARAMGRAVAGAGWTVVSGLARGVDGEAHRGTLEAGGVGVAVLGSGVDVWYPPEHRSLGEGLIDAGGAVISEFPPGTRPEPWHFPARNRLISGLSAVVVVTEAADRGGALITARLGAEQGREVFAVPGDVVRATSRGTNLLIRDGAVPVLGPDDLLEAISLVMGPPPLAVRPPGKGGVPELSIPEGGASVEAVVEANGGETARVLRVLGRLEMEGRVRIDQGQVTVVG